VAAYQFVGAGGVSLLEVFGHSDTTSTLRS
jgi:hypothetical protein